VTTDCGVDSAVASKNAKRTPGPASTCDPYREAIELGLSRGRNAMAIWQDLVDLHGFSGGYQSVRRLRRIQSPEERGDPHQREEAHVDYGTGPMVRDPHRR
jgi:hypothetical protein